MTLAQDIARLTAIEAVKDIQLHYCRGLDRLDWDLVLSFITKFQRRTRNPPPIG